MSGTKYPPWLAKNTCSRSPRSLSTGTMWSFAAASIRDSMSSNSPVWCRAISWSMIARTRSRALIALPYGVPGIDTGTVWKAARMSATSSLSSWASSGESLLT